MGLFKAVPITFIAIISYFSILGHEKFIKVICIVCSFHLVKCALSNCVFLLFRSIFLRYLASDSHVSLCKYELGYTPNQNKVNNNTLWGLIFAVIKLRNSFKFWSILRKLVNVKINRKLSIREIRAN